MQDINDYLPEVMLSKATTEELLLDSARLLLYSSYQNMQAIDKLIDKTDTTKLKQREKGLYYLTKGYYLQKNGNTNDALVYLNNAATIISEYGLSRDKAEINLIWGEVFEMTGLKSEAKESYFDALDYYKERPGLKQYFLVVLGLSRTITNDTIFRSNANMYLQMYPDVFLEQLYHYTIAYLSKNG